MEQKNRQRKVLLDVLITPSFLCGGGHLPVSIPSLNTEFGTLSDLSKLGHVYYINRRNEGIAQNSKVSYLKFLLLQWNPLCLWNYVKKYYRKKILP